MPSSLIGHFSAAEALANVADAAIAAFWASGRTHRPAVQHEPVAEIGGFFGRKDFFQGKLDLVGVLELRNKPDAVRKPDAKPRLARAVRPIAHGGTDAGS